MGAGVDNLLSNPQRKGNNLKTWISILGSNKPPGGLEIPTDWIARYIYMSTKPNRADILRTVMQEWQVLV